MHHQFDLTINALAREAYSIDNEVWLALIGVALSTRYIIRVINQLVCLIFNAAGYRGGVVIVTDQ
jgi:hypothetical protein